MRERRPRAPVEGGSGWLAVASWFFALLGVVLLASGLFESAFSGLSGERPTGTPFLVGAVCGVVSVIIGAFGWSGTRDRRVLRGWLVLGGLAGAVVLVLGARGAWENRARPPAECSAWNAPADQLGASPNVLTAVAAPSPSDAWAVGRCWGDRDRTLVLRWNGSTWRREPSPNAGVGGNLLNGVASVSAGDAWAVGAYFPDFGDPYRTLILRWDGSTWRRVPSPNDGSPDNFLNGVVATSPANAWAVGSGNGGALILRWDGTAWTREQGPDLGPGVYPFLTAVTATSETDAWAVGSTAGFTEENAQAVVYHWDGVSWTSQAVPQVGSGTNMLRAVSALSPSDVWAVGSYEEGTETRALVLHFNGVRWSHVPTPTTDVSEDLNGVAAATASSAWAVGVRGNERLVLHWDGSSWNEVPTADIGDGTEILHGVAALSPSEAVAVGVGGDGAAAVTTVGT